MLFSFGFILLLIATCTFTIALGGIMYQHLVEFPNWSADFPKSLQAYKSFFKTADFGKFFKVFMPLSAISLLTALFILWKSPATTWMIAALAGMFITAGFTNKFFVPRHEILFSAKADEKTVAELITIANEWRMANYARMIIMALTVITLFVACLINIHDIQLSQ